MSRRPRHLRSIESMKLHFDMQYPSFCEHCRIRGSTPRNGKRCENQKAYVLVRGHYYPVGFYCVNCGVLTKFKEEASERK